MAKWMLRQNRADIVRLAEQANVSPTIAYILANRGLSDPKALQKFLHPKRDDFYDPYLMKDMKKAIEILKSQIADKKKICIYGDYDVDGVMSTVILHKALRHCGADVDYYIPDRETEGYGMHVGAIHRLYEAGVETILTCDNGIAAVKEIETAKELGMTVIVLDHHEVSFQETDDGKRMSLIPMADAIIDPKQEDCTYPFKLLCAGGIAYKFVLALFGSLKIPYTQAEEYIQFAAIATVCDIVDLVDENRLLVRLGLEQIVNTQNLGLKALIEETGLVDKTISTYHIGFVLGPCINATGRLEQAIFAARLFLTEDKIEAQKLAKKLKQLNAIRKELTEEAVNQAYQYIESGALHGDQVLVVYNKEIHESIAGIVAGRIKEKYHLPTIVLTEGEHMPKGSARSIEGYNIFEELLKCKELLEKFGGHPMAAGMSLQEKNIAPLRKQLNSNCQLTEEDLLPKIRIDKQLSFEEITMDLVEALEQLSPFGKGNPAPLFAEKNILIHRIDFIGKEKNILKFHCKKKDAKSIPALSFDGFDRFQEMVIGRYGLEYFENIRLGGTAKIHMDMIFSLSINVYNGSRTLQLMVSDFRLSSSY